MKRGELWWATFPPPTGSGPAKRRPVVIVSSDAYNRSRIQTVVVALLSSNTELAKHPGNVWISSEESGLSKDSVIIVSQVITLDKDDLDSGYGELSEASVVLLDEGLRQLFAL